MKVPIVTGTGRRLELDSDDYGRLVLLPEVCDGLDLRLWDLFAEAAGQGLGFGVSTQASAPQSAATRN